MYRKWTYSSAKVVYMYDSTPGVLIFAFRAFLLVWFWYALYTTRTQFPRKWHFYNKVRRRPPPPTPPPPSGTAAAPRTTNR